MKCGDYSASDLRTPVLFERMVLFHTGSGAFREEWHPIDGSPTRAMVTYSSGTERWREERVTAGTMAKAVVRYTPGPVVVGIDGGAPASVYAMDEIDGGAHNSTYVLDGFDGGQTWDFFTGPLTTADRVTIGGRVFNIRHIDNVEMKNRWLVLHIEGGASV
jgi:hypothetical protein